MNELEKKKAEIFDVLVEMELKNKEILALETKKNDLLLELESLKNISQSE